WFLGQAAWAGGVALALGGLLFVVIGIDDAVPREQQSLHSGLLFMGIASTFLGAGLLESILRRRGSHWFGVAAIGLAAAVAYATGLMLLGRGWWTWVPLVAVLVSPVLVGICSEWTIRRFGPTWQGFPIQRRTVLVGLGAQSLAERQQHALGRLGGVFYDRLRGLDTIRRLGAGAAESRRIGIMIEEFRRRTMAVLRVAFLSSAVLEFFSAVAIAAVAIYIGLGLIGHIDFGPAPGLTLSSGLFVLLIAPELFMPLRQLSQFWHDRAAACAAALNIRAFLEAEPARPEPRKPGQVKVGSPCAVAVRGLTVRRPGRGTILDDIELDVAPGERLLVAGPSGSGKSTLLQVLAGLLAPDAGRIRFDTADLAAIDRAALARIRGWMGQQPGLIDGTLAENIAVGRGEADRVAIHEAADLAGLKPLLQQLPAGLDTRVRQDGEGLSGGQVRRIALARALVVPCPVMLLDEPTASLDADSSTAIWKTLERIAHERAITIICASHDPAAPQWAQRVLSLADGRLEEKDP
ncbi:MAG: ABC transporter ATP-binding protein/permease, partial [Wenzhouxiangella sp.]